MIDNYTICVFAYNEESRIRHYLKNILKVTNKIIVIDNYSTDSTAKICLDLGVKFKQIKNDGFIETTDVMDKVQSYVDTEYLLIASISEFLPFSLLKKYEEIAEKKEFDVARAFRVSITSGKAIPISGKPTANKFCELRFFRKYMVNYSGNKVHSRGVSIGKEVALYDDPKLHFYQFRDYDCSHTEFKHRVYNDLMAKQRYSNGEKFSFIKLFYFSSKYFFDSYFRFGSYKYGMLGFIQSFQRWQMEVNIWLRVWEYETGNDSESIKSKNKKVKDDLEKKYEEEIL